MERRTLTFCGILGGIIAVAAIILVSQSPKNPTPQPVEQEVAEVRPEDKIETQRPPDQAALIELISRAIADAQYAKNDIEEDRVNKKNDQDYCEAFNKISVMQNWTGRIGPLGINSNGAIEIGAEIGDLDDVVPVGSPLYEKIAKLSNGQPVVFSGKFNRQRDGDVAGSACDPRFDSSYSAHRYDVVLTDIQAL